MKGPAAALFAILLFIGCGGKEPRTAEEYFGVASEHLRSGAYPMAVDHYRELLDQHPFSEFTEEAELRIAHAHYKNDSCPEAIAALVDFQRRYPTSPHLALVGFLIGQCHEQQMQPPDRDQSASKSAHAYLQAVIQQYPESPFADLARQRLHHCRESLAKHELVVADYYEEHNNTKAAEVRLLDLVNRFSDTDTAGRALYLLGELYSELGADNRAALAYAAVLYHHPDNDVAQAADTALSELGPPEERPSGDPLAVLKVLSGRSRSLALVQMAGPRPSSKSTRSAGAPGRMNLPGGFGPFGGGGSGGRGY